MNIEDIANALELQKRSYSLLLWTANSAPRFLEADTLSAAPLCEQWLAKHWNLFPAEARPGLGELKTFAQMLTSFFNTSFRLEGAPGKYRLVRGRKFKDRRNKKYALGRAERDAAELNRIALENITAHENIPATTSELESILQDESNKQAVNLWSYGCELVRRSQFASQGPAVHQLWLELDEEKRKALSAEAIWKAREALNKKTQQYGQ